MIRRFAWVAEGDVFFMFTFDDQTEQGQRWAAGLNSAPIVFEVDPESLVGVGWTHNGENFVPPSEQI